MKNYAVDEDRLGILGYSMGGRIALTVGAGSDNPYKAIGLLAPSADWGQEMMVGFLGGQAEYDRLYAESGGDKGYAEFTTQWGQVQQLSRQWFDDMIASKPLELAGSFKGPMIVVHGDKDVVVPAAVNEAVIAAYPEASLVVVPEADHGYGFYSDQPDVTTLVDTTFADFFAESLK
ncbi:alpha/beta hydrolase family protein [Devosia riboflavina]